MPVFIYVALGGAIGALARYGINLLTLFWYAGSFPVGTLLVNSLGGLLIGLGWSTIGNDMTKAFLLTGVLGGFTTFSAFSLETVRLFESGATGLALFNILLNNGLGIFFCFAGFSLAKVMS
jgi:fluoride exporter